MRMIRLLGSVTALVAGLSGSVTFGQAVPPNAVPLIAQVSPPSLTPTSTAPGNVNFTLTILGANFPSTAVVNLAASPTYILHPAVTTVNSTGSQITAQFTNTVLGSPGTFAVTVTNPGGTPPSTSNPFYLPYTPTEPSVVLNQNLTTFLTGSPKGILTADLNGNGSLDLAVVSEGTNTVSILQSNFTGNFTSGGSYSTGSQPWGIVAADFFGTGQLGLAITNSADNTITILLPNGGGTFRLGTTISLPGVFPTQLVAADFNGDGKIDLAVVNTCGAGPGVCFPQAAPQGPGTVTILLGNGDGTFAVSPAMLTTGNVPYAMAAADLNGDGIIDLVVANQSGNNLSIFMGNGDGTFTPASASPTTGNAPSAIAIGDFNGDGNLDLAVTNSTDNTVSILLNQNCSSLPLALCAFAPAPASPAVGASPVAISTADMNADGFLDLVVANSTGNSVSVLLGNGTGAFNAVVPQGQPDFSTGAAPQGLVLGDFNQDGRLDIVTSNASGSFTFLRQAGAPQLVLTTSNPAPFYGLFLTFTVNVSPLFGQPASPTGTITFFDSATAIGTVSLSGYQANFYYPYLNAGSHQVTAVYSGDSNFVSATSNAVSENVTQAQTTTTLTSNVNGVSYVQPFTLSATIQPQNTGTATGTVTFFDTSSSTSLGSGTLVNNVAQLTLSKLTPGAHVIVASYQGDTNFTGSNSATYTENVILASTTITVASSPNPITLGQTTTLTATVQPGAGNTATGAVIFLDNMTPLGFASVSNNSAQFTVSTLSVGTHAITAQYGGDTNFSSSTSAPIPETVNQGSVSVGVSSNNNPSTYGQAVTLIANVQPISTTTTPTGSITFMIGGATVSIVPLSNSSSQLSVSTMTVGTNLITAKYSGDSNFQASYSSFFVQNVTQAVTSTTITSSLNPSPFGQSVTFSAAVQPTFGGSATGNVTFYDGATSLGSVTPTSNSAQFTVSNFTAGSHSITARYLGDSNTGASTSAAVSQSVTPGPTTTTITSSSNPSTYGQAVTFVAAWTPTAAGFPGGTISIYEDGTLVYSVGIAAGAPQITLYNMPAGTHTLTAQFTPLSSNYAPSTSATLTQTVNQAASLIQVSSNVNPSTYGQSVTLNASISTTGHFSSAANGTLTFLDNGASIGSVTLPGNTNYATVTTTTLNPGAHSITVSYSGDANFAAGTSAVFTQTVNPEPTTTYIASTTYTPAFAQSITLTATVKPLSGTTATGTVTFLDRTTAIGTATLSSNSAQFAISTLTPGTHYISAQYSGDANTAASTSGQTLVTVSPPPTTTLLSSSQNPSSLNQPVTFTATLQLTSSGTPTGTVTFYDGSFLLGTATITNGSAQFTDPGFQIGTQSITATYSGDANFSGSTSATLSQVVNPGPTTTSVTSNSNPSIVGNNVTFTVNVYPPYGGTPTGLVTLYDGSTSLGSASLINQNGQNYALFTLSTLTTGAHSMTATYNGSVSFAASTSAVLTQTVNLPASATYLTPVANPVVYGQALTLVASVQPPRTGTATGTVTFFDGATSLGMANVSNNTAQLSVSTLSLGSHSLTAQYSGNPNYAGSTSAPVTETVNPSVTTTTVSPNINPSNLGQSIVITAVVVPSAGGTTTGTVTFLDGTTSLGTATVSGNIAQFSLSSLSVGSHSITAKYSGDGNFTASTSTVVTETVSQATTTTTVASNLNPAAFGQAVTFTVSVQPSAGGTPTGTVTLMDGVTALGNSSLSSAGSAQFTLGGLSAGAHSVTAVYSGDANFTASTSAALVETVNQGSTTSTLSSSANPSSFDQTVTFTTTVQSPVGTTATGAVTFMDGSTSLGTATLSSNSAQLAISALTVGAHSVTAVYAGSANLSGSTSAVLSQVVNGASTTTTVSSSVNPSTFGQSVTLSASIQTAFGGNATGTFTFLDGATSLGTATVSSNAAQLSLSSLSAGAHSITAKYNGDTNFSGSTSAVITQIVNQGSTATGIASSLNPAVFGQSVAFTANVQAPAGITASGTVTFLDGATSLGTATVSNNSAQLAVSGLSLGSHSVTASYGGNANLSGSTSLVLTQSVNQAATATGISSSANPATFGQAVTFTATVQPAAGGVPTGTITFFDGGAQIASGGLSGGVAQFTAAGGTLATGTHSITARYGGDANFVSSTSGTLAETVNAAPTSTLLTTNSNPSVTGHSVTFTATVSSSVAGTQSGTVRFYFDGSTSPAGSATLSAGTAQFSTSSLGAGNHTVAATFASSNSNFQGSSSATLTEEISDFSVSASPAALTVSRSHSGTYTLTVSPLSGFTGAVSLSCSGVPSHTTCGISPSPVTLNGTSSAQATVTITVGGNASTGKHTLTFKGTSGTLTHSTTVTLTIN